MKIAIKYKGNDTEENPQKNECNKKEIRNEMKISYAECRHKINVRKYH